MVLGPRLLPVALGLVALVAGPGSAFRPPVALPARAAARAHCAGHVRRTPLPSRARGATLRSMARPGRGGAASLCMKQTSRFMVGVLGDLHLDPRKMEDYQTGREQFVPIFKEGLEEHGNVALVSLGDLGESKSVRPEETAELFSGTTECHRMAAEYLGSFGVPYEVIGGNHDLEVGPPLDLLPRARGRESQPYGACVRAHGACRRVSM